MTFTERGSQQSLERDIQKETYGPPPPGYLGVARTELLLQKAMHSAGTARPQQSLAKLSKKLSGEGVISFETFQFETTSNKKTGERTAEYLSPQGQKTLIRRHLAHMQQLKARPLAFSAITKIMDEVEKLITPV